MRTQQQSFPLYILFFMVVILCSASFGQAPAEIFNQYCKSCHTIGGGKLIGPDLKDVTQRQDRAWLVKWIVDPVGVLGAKDPYALKLQKAANGAIMSPTPGMNESMAGALLDFIEKESADPSSQYAGNKARALLPMTREDAATGYALFTGLRSFKSGGPACFACHTVNKLPGLLGGGRLGPNLSDAYTRLGQQAGLSAWLSAPPGLTMTPIFSRQPLGKDEIHALVSFLNDQAASAANPNAMAVGNFVIISLISSTLFLLVFGLVWSGRFTGVRKKLFKQSYSA